eukprot:TRINITY_DN3037_c0_g1_i1.p1 TRINITY_DN3037_c0_g1~~TRINITY_DN3037_c0_g1_i1.p1  ORF type:complete len:215 (-),score=68.17 TRINITY_DN3037_c0_g1_i1:193-837(-)
MSNCKNEHHEHGHDDHDHDHGLPEGYLDEEYSLYKFILTDQMTCLNESVPDMAKNVFKPYVERLDQENYLESNDDDPQLLLYIPFNGDIKLKSICIIGGDLDSAPRTLKVWKNKDNIDFSNCEDIQATQEFELDPNLGGQIEYRVKTAKFNNVSSLTFFVEDNWADIDQTRITYIGLKGDYLKNKREAVKAVYEIRPQVADHKTKMSEMGKNIM